MTEIVRSRVLELALKQSRVRHAVVIWPEKEHRPSASLRFEDSKIGSATVFNIQNILLVSLMLNICSNHSTLAGNR